MFAFAALSRLGRNACAAAFALGLFSLATPAFADPVATFTITPGAHFDDGGSLSGWFSYSYNVEGITSIDAFDIVTGPGTSQDGEEYIFNVDGKQTNMSLPSVWQSMPNFPANAFAVMTMTGDDFLEIGWRGNQLVSGDPDQGQATTEEWPGHSDTPRFLETTVTPEPSSVLLLGVGLAGFGFVQRARRKAR